MTANKDRNTISYAVAPGGFVMRVGREISEDERRNYEHQITTYKIPHF